MHVLRHQGVARLTAATDADVFGFAVVHRVVLSPSRIKRIDSRLVSTGTAGSMNFRPGLLPPPLNRPMKVRSDVVRGLLSHRVLVRSSVCFFPPYSYVVVCFLHFYHPVADIHFFIKICKLYILTVLMKAGINAHDFNDLRRVNHIAVKSDPYRSTDHRSTGSEQA